MFCDAFVKSLDVAVTQSFCAVTRAYHITPGETTEDGVISLLTARCLGSCSLAPAAIMDEDVVGNLTPECTLTVLEGWTQS